MLNGRATLFYSNTRRKLQDGLGRVVDRLTSQRFRFYGDQDCPDWLLAEINLLTRVVRV